MGAVGHCGQLDFEGIDLGPEWGDPPTLEGPVDRSLVGDPGVGRG
jgi:hypothetical protein